jgi:hypothetical protein
VVRAQITVGAYLKRVRRRAWGIHAVRALVLGTGASALTFAIAALVAGPIAGPLGSGVAAALVLLATLLGAGWCLRPLRELRGAGAARLLDTREPQLVSAARSAVELEGDAVAASAAPALVHAHQQRVQAALVQVPVRQVVPWSRIRHPAVLGGALAVGIAGGILAASDRAASGAYALVHPGAQSADGLKMAAVVSETRARLVFPSHVGRAPVVVRNAELLEAPRGTTVHYAVRPRVAATDAALEVAGLRVRLTTGDQGAYEAEFVVRQSGPIRIRLQDAHGRWLEDPAGRRIRAIDDEVPAVQLHDPAADLTVELQETVAVDWSASDDLGLRSVDLVVQSPDGRETRRTLLRKDAHRQRTRARGRTEVVAADFSARPGDPLVLWIEARDGDLVSGPNVGLSARRTLTVVSESNHRMDLLADMGAALDAGLGALADRLERPVPAAATDARARFAVVERSSEAFAETLTAIAERAGEQRSGGSGEASVYRAMASRHRHALKTEKRAHGERVQPARARQRHDQAVVDQLETDVLLLADMLGKARIQDAAAIARELESLRREMTSLVAELRRADSAEARRALQGAIARAQARMRELLQRLAQMGEDVPSDFVNAEAIDAPRSMDALQAMQEALERGDLSELERQLDELEHQIHSLAEALGSAEGSFAEARFGPRERAMAEALDALAGLEAEQRELFRRSDDVRRGAAERALQASEALSPEAASKLAGRARQTNQSLRQLPGDALGPLEEEALSRARQRLDDSADALEARDLGEARRMSREAVRDLEALARDLELSALMFPGRNGQVGQAARVAREGAKRARELRDEIDGALPRLRDHLAPAGRRQLQEDATRQGDTARAASDLALRFEKGPDGNPLAPDAADGMREAERAMRQALDRLRDRDPLGASRAQEDASRRLSELREELESGRRPQGGGEGMGQGGGGSGARRDPRQRVQIPGAEEHEGPTERRRRVLDAMRENAPRGFEHAVQRYYEELLR